MEMKFAGLIQTIRDASASLQQGAVKAINRLLTIRNWFIGYYSTAVTDWAIAACPIRKKNQFDVEPGKLIQYLSFSHFAELITIDDPVKRSFYEIECIKGTWSIRELHRQISTLYYERSGMSRKPELLSEQVQQSAEQLSIHGLIKFAPFRFSWDDCLRNAYQSSGIKKSVRKRNTN